MTFQVLTLWTAFSSKWPLVAFGQAWDLGHPLTHCLYHWPVLRPLPDIGEAVPGMGTRCEEEVPAARVRLGYVLPTPATGPPGQRGGDLAVRGERSPKGTAASHFTVDLILKGRKAGAKPINFLNTPEIQIK